MSMTTSAVLAGSITSKGCGRPARRITRSSTWGGIDNSCMRDSRGNGRKSNLGPADAMGSSANFAGRTGDKADRGLLRRGGLRLGRGVDEAAGLALPQRRIVAAVAQQLLVRALLDDGAVVEHDQPVHAGDGGEAVGGGGPGLVRHQGVEARLDGGLDLAVERRGRLLEHHDRRVLLDTPRA